MNKVDILNVHSLIKNTRIQELTIDYNGERVTLKQKNKILKNANNKLQNVQNKKSGEKYITSDQVGYFSMKNINFKVGDIVNEEAVIGFVDTLGTVNSILSKNHGRIIEILIKEGVPVEYGQPLIKIR